jgi:hypothetical protein
VDGNDPIDFPLTAQHIALRDKLRVQAGNEEKPLRNAERVAYEILRRLCANQRPTFNRVARYILAYPKYKKSRVTDSFGIQDWVNLAMRVRDALAGPTPEKSLASVWKPQPPKPPQ